MLPACQLVCCNLTKLSLISENAHVSTTQSHGLKLHFERATRLRHNADIRKGEYF